MRSSSRRGSGRHQPLDTGRTDLGQYHRSPSQQLEQAMSRLELARAYGMRASERNRKKQGTRSKSASQKTQQQEQHKSLRRSLSAGGALYTEPIPEDIACHRDAGYMSKRRAAYLDGDDHDVRLHNWVHCSSMYHSDMSRDSQGSPVSGQDPVNPIFMSSTCISEAISGGISDRVDRGVQTLNDVGTGGIVSKNGINKAEKKVQTEAPWRSVGIGQEGEDPTSTSYPLVNGNVMGRDGHQQSYSSQFRRKVEDVSPEENPEEVELQRRVEELRKSVAAMRSEARMLELQTEERVLLKEINALGSYLRNARNLLASLDKTTPLDGGDHPEADPFVTTKPPAIESSKTGALEVEPSGKHEFEKEAPPSAPQQDQKGALVEKELHRVTVEGGAITNGKTEGGSLDVDITMSNQQLERDATRSEHASSPDRGLLGVNVGATDLDTPRGHQGAGGQGSDSSASHELNKKERGMQEGQHVPGVGLVEGNPVGQRSRWEVEAWEVGIDEHAESPVNTATLELSDSERDDDRAAILSSAGGETLPEPVADGRDDLDFEGEVEEEEEEEEDAVEQFHEFDLSAFKGGVQAARVEGKVNVRPLRDVQSPTSPPVENVSYHGNTDDASGDEPADQPRLVSSPSDEGQKHWMDTEDEYGDDGELSLEQRSMQMMMRMHDDQVRECGDYMSNYMAAHIAKDGPAMSPLMNNEEAQDDENATSNSREDDYELNDEQVLMELESILKKEIDQVQSSMGDGEEFETAKLDISPRTWRLDFDINEVEEECPPPNTMMNNSDVSNRNDNDGKILFDAESEEMLVAQETNRESASSRELSTRTDCDYIEEFVEEVMRTFQINTPNFSSAFSAPVPWKVFVDIQMARKSNKDQSIFDRCIFEALNEAVADTYRTCNRVLSINRSDDEEDGHYIALPADEEWINDVKNKVLKAVNHRSLHTDAIGAILSQDVFYLHNSVMDLHDELEEVQKEQLFA